MRIGFAAWTVGVVLALAAAAPAGATDSDAYRVARGFKIAPVPLNLRGLDRNEVGLGSYLVNAAGGCNDCHSVQPFATGHDPYLGQPKKTNAATYLSGGRAFGPFISANITPDARRLPAGLTLNQFIAVMRTGRDPDDQTKLLQVMPWPIYQDMRYVDLKAIYAYLKAIPSLVSPTP